MQTSRTEGRQAVHVGSSGLSSFIGFCSCVYMTYSPEFVQNLEEAVSFMFVI
jgi:hypothetical protein